MKKEQGKTVGVTLDLGDLKPLVQRAAKLSGLSVNDFICDAVQSRVRREQEYAGRDRYTPHGGEHRQGKHTGYEVTKDGRYYPAPSWAEQFEQMFAERSAIYNLVNSVIATAQERLIKIEKSITQAKVRLVDDIGLDPTKEWVYYGGERGYLQEHKESDEAAKGDGASAPSK